MMEYNRPGNGVKRDTGKHQWHLLPLAILRGVVDVLMFGAKKYAPNNWRLGMPWSQVYNAAMRHLITFWEDRNDLDPETKLHEIDHAICCLLFLRHYTLHFPHLDDRYQPGVQDAVEDGEAQ